MDDGGLLADPWRDARRVHLLTRGNVDGITSAALVMRRYPDARVSFVTNALGASFAMRRDLSSDTFIVVDLGLDPELAKTMARKRAGGVRAILLDHHEQTLVHEDLLPSAVERLIIPGMSAAAVVREWLQEPGLAHVVALADEIEFCTSPGLDDTVARFGHDRVTEEARLLDFAWRCQIADDRFRQLAARRLAQGLWPSEIGEVRRRYLQMLNEGRWERALERVRSKVEIRGTVALLRFGRRKPSLFGFGARALAAVAAEAGCTVAVLVHRREDVTSVSARALPPLGDAVERRRREINLGRFFDTFTSQYGIAGGGHPESAGGKIPSRHLGVFLRELETFA